MIEARMLHRQLTASTGQLLWLVVNILELKRSQLFRQKGQLSRYGTEFLSTHSIIRNLYLAHFLARYFRRTGAGVK